MCSHNSAQFSTRMGGSYRKVSLVWCNCCIWECMSEHSTTVPTQDLSGWQNSVLSQRWNLSMGLQGTKAAESSLIQPCLKLLMFRLCLMINSIGDFVAVTMPFVNHNPRPDPMVPGNNFKDAPHHSAQEEDYRQWQTRSACVTLVSKIQLRIPLEWNQDPLNVCAEQQDFS